MNAVRALVVAMAVLGLGVTAAHAQCCGDAAYTTYYAGGYGSYGDCCYSSYYSGYYPSYSSWYSPYSTYYSGYYSAGYWPARRYSAGYRGWGGCCW